jgi:adenylosuccinate synthase
MGNGMVINPETLLREIDILENMGVSISPDRLKVSPAAHLITPAHRALDAAQEAQLGQGQIGTTLRGIGPAYMDKSARRGLRVEEMLDEESLADRVKEHVEFTNRNLTNLYNADPLHAQSVAAQFVDHARRIRPFIADTTHLVNQTLDEGGKVLAEGAQGTLLDLDHGTYPYVTSSNPTAAGALVGLGVGPRHVGDVIGVAKAFQTRVGEGAMPTELEGDLALCLRGTGENPWDEYGTTTGRPRRVGWLDLVLLRYAVRLNGLNHLALTKLDILTGIDPLRLCVAYQKNGHTFPDLPMGTHDLDAFEPVYRDLPGWDGDIQSARTWDELPPPAQDYVRIIEEETGVAVGWISVGAERTQLVVR